MFATFADVATVAAFVSGALLPAIIYWYASARTRHSTAPMKPRRRYDIDWGVKDREVVDPRS